MITLKININIDFFGVNQNHLKNHDDHDQNESHSSASNYSKQAIIWTTKSINMIDDKVSFTKLIPSDKYMHK